jgi:hypothetical protein
MKKADLDKSEKIIRAGLEEAERVIQVRALEMKKETPGLPIGVLEIQARHASNNTVAAALHILADQRELLEQSEDAA